MNFKRFHESKNLFDVSTVEKGRIDNGEVGYTSQTSSLTIEGGTVSFTTTATYRGVCSGFFEIPEGTETIAFNFTRNEALGVKFVFYDSAKIWLNQDYTPTLADIPPATANIPTGAKYVRLSFTGQIVGGYSYAMSDIMLNSGSQPLPYEPYSSEVWHDIPHYIHKTDADTFTTLPAVLYPNGSTATVGLKGNTLQSSIPSPTSLIMPQGTGERTGNLLDYTTVESTTNATATQISGGISVSGRYYVRFRTVEFTVGSTYTMSWKANTIGGTSAPAWRFHYADNTYSSMPSSGGSLVVEKEVSELLLYVSTTESCVVDFTEIMLNTGSTPLPYEKFGYKIPISSASTTTPVYLGEVETTRKIRKLVFDGSEPWVLSGNIIYINNTDTERLSPLICTHFPNVQNTGMWNGNSWVFQVNISNLGMAGRGAWITYLQQQYAAGTPVTVWYVLANEETAVVNEPLMKIGEYADEVSGITIPTIAGANTISVDTTLQPSEVTVNYKGWHPVQSVHEAENGQWD